VIFLQELVNNLPLNIFANCQNRPDQLLQKRAATEDIQLCWPTEAGKAGWGNRSHWSILVVGPVDVSGHLSLSFGHGAGTLWPFVNGRGGPLWVLVNHSSWPSWPIIRGCGGPSSPSIGGGAGRPWTFMGGHHHFSIVVVGLMANHRWSWWADRGCGWS